MPGSSGRPYGRTTILLDTPQERALALATARVPTAIDVTLETYSPHKLCTYLFDLATDFTAFYEHCPVLKADEPVAVESPRPVRPHGAHSRATPSDLLGIDAPEQM